MNRELSEKLFSARVKKLREEDIGEFNASRISAYLDCSLSNAVHFIQCGIKRGAIVKKKYAIYELVDENTG